MNRWRGNRELLTLTLLLALFTLFAAYYERIGQQQSPSPLPGSYNPRPPGAKALYLLLEQMGFRVGRHEAPWTALTAEDSLLLAVEPFHPERAITAPEIEALRNWVARGGTVAYFAASAPRPLDAEDTVFGDVEAVVGPDKPQSVSPRGSSPALRNVSELAFSGPARLKPAKSGRYRTLAADDAGAFILHKPLGKGQVFLIAGNVIVRNDGIRQADNALFVVNLAADTAGRGGGNILFDEYHHGSGYEGGIPQASLWASVPIPLRLTCWHLLGFGLLMLYNGNRRFGRPRAAETPAPRSGADTLRSLARLYRRADGAILALETLAHTFRRDLTRHLALPPDAPTSLLAQQAARRWNVEEQEIRDILERCEALLRSDGAREAEVYSLAQRLESLRRRLPFD